MYRLAKWAYDMGVKAERNRIKRLIAEHFTYTDKLQLQLYGHHQNIPSEEHLLIMQEVSKVLASITKPREDFVPTELKATPIDED